MKALDQPTLHEGTNGWGGTSRSYHQTFEVEASDVGATRENYRGFGHSSHKFTRTDVGKTIDVLTDGTGWMCWTFGRFNK